MKPHDTFLELAAIAIDFPLASAERGRLEQHLAGCAACGRTAHALRGDALALSHLPPVILPERRGAEILAAALHPHAVRNPVRLLVVAALLGLLLLGSLAAGAELLRRMDQDDLGVVLPVPSQAASPDAGPSASPGPAAAEPPGRLAVTHADPSGDRRVELLDLDGLGVTNLTPGLGWDPAWLSDTQVVYTCPRMDETLPGICAVDSTKPDELPRRLLAEADHPVPAPDGRTIAIHRGMIDVGETWIMSADGSNPRLLRSGWFPRWSPDGAWLAGQPEGDRQAEVAIVGADGQGFRVLAPGYDPAWSPTGRRIAFAVVEGDVASLRTVDLASGAVEILHTAPAGEEISAPAYLAEGRIAFVQDGNVWIFDSSGPRAHHERACDRGLAGWRPPGRLPGWQPDRVHARDRGRGHRGDQGDQRWEHGLSGERVRAGDAAGMGSDKRPRRSRPTAHPPGPHPRAPRPPREAARSWATAGSPRRSRWSWVVRSGASRP